MKASILDTPAGEGPVQPLAQGFVRVMRNVVDVATPTLLRPGRPQTAETTRTSWMNGLRGICAVIVVNFHFLFTFTPLAVLGYNATAAEAAGSHIAALPPFCLLWDGASSVNMFFTISGYVCSYKALELMSVGSDVHSLGPVMESLSSSAFRRTFRLLLPVLAMSLLTTLVAHVGGFGLTQEMFADAKVWFLGVSSEPNPPRFQSFLAQIGFWAREMSSLMNIFEPKAVYPKHDAHLWTIGYEYKMSLHVYTALLVLARTRPYVRLLSLCALALLYAFWHHWEGPLFFLGAASAQWDVLQQAQRREVGCSVLDTGDGELSVKEERAAYDSMDTTKQPGLRKLRISRLRLFGFVMAIYFMAYPVDNIKHPAYGYHWLNAFIPSWYSHRENKFPKSLGTTILLYLLLTVNEDRQRCIWRRILESRVATYLGKIMFALYLVHGPVLHAIGYAVPHWIWQSIGGSQNTWQWCAGMLGGWLVSITTCLWLADIFHREVESRCVSLQSWIERVCVS